MPRTLAAQDQSGHNFTLSRTLFVDGSSERRLGPILEMPTLLKDFGDQQGMWAVLKVRRPWTMAALVEYRYADTLVLATAIWEHTRQQMVTIGRFLCLWITTHVVLRVHQTGAIRKCHRWIPSRYPKLFGKTIDFGSKKREALFHAHKS